MEKITLSIKDTKDLMILWAIINNAQAIGRHRLAVECNKNDKIESKWTEETIDEWDRLMTLKVQIEHVLDINKA